MRKSLIILLISGLLFGGCCGRQANPIPIYRPGDTNRGCESLRVGSEIPNDMVLLPAGPLACQNANLGDLAAIARHWLTGGIPIPDDMVVVPAGSFAFQEASLGYDFAIGKYEVTVAAYCEFLNDGDPDGKHWDSRQEIVRTGDPGNYSYEVQAGRENYPVRWVSSYDAEAYAAWKSAKTGSIYRLPTQQEWGKAAGWDPVLKKLWSYGFQRDSVDSTWCNYNNAYGGLLPVGSFNGTDGKNDAQSYYGCFDMTGNISELTLSMGGRSSRVSLGGYWTSRAKYCGVAYPYVGQSSSRHRSRGFRLILDLNSECPTADVTGDCYVGLADLAVMTSQWMPGGISVPDGMVLVGAGPFAYFDSRPENDVFLDDFMIDKYEVTVASYCEFLNDGDPDGKHWDSRQEIVRAGDPGNYSYEVQAGRQNYPVRWVSFVDVEAYAAWKSAKASKSYRLPTEREWKKAAGWDPVLKKLWKYSFQRDVIDSSWCNYRGTYGGPLPVGSFNGTNGKNDAQSYYGCYDMTGNVLEWTSSRSSDSGRVARGGFWTGGNWRVSSRYYKSPSDRYYSLGFRLALDL